MKKTSAINANATLYSPDEMPKQVRHDILVFYDSHDTLACGRQGHESRFLEGAIDE